MSMSKEWLLDRIEKMRILEDNARKTRQEYEKIYMSLYGYKQVFDYLKASRNDNEKGF